MTTSYFTCICGFIGNNGHALHCKTYKSERLRVAESIKTYIGEYYTTNYSVTECCELVKTRENTQLYQSALRNIITKELKEAGIFQGLAGKEFNDKRQTKIQKTTMSRYGVKNIGQLPNHGFALANKIPYEKLDLSDEFLRFKKKVESLSWKHFGKLKKANTVPTQCHYTGITFNDVTLGEVNPNDPKKRTLDHKVSVSTAFILGWTPEQTCEETNLVYCLRIVNTFKGNTSEAEFRSTILPALITRLYNEN